MPHGTTQAILYHQEPVMNPKPHLHELTPSEVHDSLHHRAIVLIDVREPQEYVTERIHGGLLFPLSSFDPRALPAGDRPIVLHCGSDKRSATAIAKCIEAGVPIAQHMKGGIMAWKHARYPPSHWIPIPARWSTGGKPRASQEA
jgi:rhodanese-related sulfurtransferase